MMVLERTARLLHLFHPSFHFPLITAFLIIRVTAFLIIRILLLFQNRFTKRRKHLLNLGSLEKELVQKKSFSNLKDVFGAF